MKIDIFSKKFERDDEDEREPHSAKKSKMDTNALVAILQQASSIAAPKIKRKAAAKQAEKSSSAASSSGRIQAGTSAAGCSATSMIDSLADIPEDPSDDDGGMHAPEADASDFFSLAPLNAR